MLHAHQGSRVHGPGPRRWQQSTTTIALAFVLHVETHTPDVQVQPCSVDGPEIQGLV